LVVELHQPVVVRFPSATRFEAGGHEQDAHAGEEIKLPSGRVMLPAGADIPLPSGTPAQTGSEWARPVTSHGEGSPLYIYSLLLATFLGTMGLPHILVRFYTNPDGAAARRTTVRVLALLSMFYLFPAVYGALGRALAPGLYMTGQTDTVVLTLPAIAWPGTGGNLLAAMTAAGAFAAFMSTSSGLLISIAGTISHDVWVRGRQLASMTVRRRRFRIVAALGMAGPAALALAAQNIDISIMVGWAFALAASTFCPLFLLGIWWSGLTARGAAAGIIVGGVLAVGAIIAGALIDAQSAGGAVNALLTQPAIISVPVAFAAMITVSLATPRPKDVSSQMLALHAPEGLGLEALERVRA
jgi:Na+(H+)/acetate symporter ActP